MQRKFWRRVWVWDLEDQVWVMTVNEPLLAFDPFQCIFGNSWCAQPQPYVYEQWWSFTASTIGTSLGSWHYLGARINWGNDPVVN